MHHIYRIICVICGIFLAIAVPAGAWTAGIDITTGLATYELEYGIEPNTTAEFDNGVDEGVPPPAPTMTKAAYFVTTGLFRELTRDIRPEVGWQLYIMSNEDVSVTWDQPPVSLRLTPVTVTGSEVLYQEEVNMDTQQSLYLVSGTHYLTISASDAGSGEPANPGIITYHPPAVVTATPTPVPDDTPTPTPVPTAVQTEKTPAATAAPTAVPVPTGDSEQGMTVAVPANTTTLPTQSPLSAIIPLAGAGIFLLIYLRKQ